MAVYGFLAYAIARVLPLPRDRFEVAFWTFVLILFVGFSWIFLSVHYTTDVASGFLVGGFGLLVGWTLAERHWNADLVRAAAGRANRNPGPTYPLARNVCSVIGLESSQKLERTTF